MKYTNEWEVIERWWDSLDQKTIWIFQYANCISVYISKIIEIIDEYENNRNVLCPVHLSVFHVEYFIFSRLTHLDLGYWMKVLIDNAQRAKTQTQKAPTRQVRSYETESSLSFLSSFQWSILIFRLACFHSRRSRKLHQLSFAVEHRIKSGIDQKVK